ncbi:hypothetical protein Purlil1_3277 [Purpureocillium lilacinum]|uniref:Uncharacterized protein n=2 Tax=Purpureocillium lilacinum TaxID=33203 RepID=A0ABR0C9N2_PURLI|nr:hypothetical protein Purlil1_3277 [Purpureocillium lilacinum]
MTKPWPPPPFMLHGDDDGMDGGSACFAFALQGMQSQGTETCVIRLCLSGGSPPGLMSPCLLAFAFACGSVETGELETGDSHSQTQRSLRPAKTAISCLLGVAKSGQAVRGLGQKAWPKACLVGPRQNLRNNSSLSPASSSSLGLGQALEGVGWRFTVGLWHHNHHAMPPASLVLLAPSVFLVVADLLRHRIVALLPPKGPSSSTIAHNSLLTTLRPTRWENRASRPILRDAGMQAAVALPIRRVPARHSRKAATLPTLRRATTSSSGVDRAESGSPSRDHP